MHEKKISDLKNTYQLLKSKNLHINFLDSIVDYCKFIGFDYDKTAKMIKLIIGCIPSIGQSWTEAKIPDDDEVKFHINLKNNFKEEKTTKNNEK